MRPALIAIAIAFTAPPRSEVVDGQRRLVAPPGYQTISQLDGGPTGLYYDAPADLLRGRNVSEVALLGLGGGEMLRAARRVQPSAHLIGVEIDPRIVALAVTDFGLTGLGNLTIFTADAREWVKEARPPHLDAVMVDIYVGPTLPSWTTEEAFLRDCLKLLRPGGLFLTNIHKDASRTVAMVELLKKSGLKTVRVSMYGANAIVSGEMAP